MMGQLKSEWQTKKENGKMQIYKDRRLKEYSMNGLNNEAMTYEIIKE